MTRPDLPTQEVDSWQWSTVLYVYASEKELSSIKNNLGPYEEDIDPGVDEVEEEDVAQES